MIVKPSQVEAALAFKDGDHVAEIYWKMAMSIIEYDEARAAAFDELNDGSVEERKAKVLLNPYVKEFARAKALAETEWRRLSAKIDKADKIISLFQTESKNAREGVL